MRAVSAIAVLASRGRKRQRRFPVSPPTPPSGGALFPRTSTHDEPDTHVRFADEPTIRELIVQLNHLHICVPDVAAASAFFVDHFAFRLREMQGSRRLAGGSGA
jgi:hypothetical protein